MTVQFRRTANTGFITSAERREIIRKAVTDLDAAVLIVDPEQRAQAVRALFEQPGTFLRQEALYAAAVELLAKHGIWVGK